MPVSTIVLAIHSLVRFILLLVALAGLVKAIIGLAQKAKADQTERVLSSAFVGLYDLQVLLGILIIFVGQTTEFVHPIVMFVGVVAAHGLQAMGKHAEGQPARMLRVGLYGVPLLIILFGLMVIGRLPI